MLLGLPTSLQGFISAVLWATTLPQPTNSALTFRLRHQHAVVNDSLIVFSDIPKVASYSGDETEFTIPTLTTSIPRPKSFEPFTSSRRDWKPGLILEVIWEHWDVPTPDVSKLSTLVQLAKMSANSYAFDNSTSDWYDLFDGWRSTPHGWLPGDDGLRGHIFVSDDNSTVVISMKGTSAGRLAGGGGPTVHRDKLNDNLLFSCCCGRVGPTWSTVCDCYKGNNRCDSDCIEEALKDDSLFYPIGLNLYNNVSYLYPNSNIWLTGHSLGGGLAALMGATFGAPVVAFEAPAEKRAWQRLHLPVLPSTNHITHVYNTGDPIPQGACIGMTSLCSIGGFALETRCHTGQVILYDTVQKLGWSVDIRNHPIKIVLDRILSEDGDWKPEFNGELEKDESEDSFGVQGWGWWPGRKSDEKEKNHGKRYREVPLPRPAVEIEGSDGVCTDCFNWDYGAFKDTTAPSSCH